MGLQAGADSGRRVWLLNEVVPADLQCSIEEAIRAVAHKENDGCAAISFDSSKLLAHDNAVHPMHFETEQKNVDLHRPCHCERLLSGLCLNNVVTFGFKELLQGIPGFEVIFGNEDGRAFHSE